MKKLVALLWCGLAIPLASSAIDLKEAKFTQVVNDVQVITPSKSIEAAAVNDLFKIPDVLRTGPDSRAELVAADHTVTRVGADTIFSFDPTSRTIDLKQGSLLFHSDKGMGGGTIRTGAATASVLGTTIIVTTTPNGGFKLLDLEGNAEIHFLNGLQQRLSPGQMTFILPSGQRAPIIIFRLDRQTKGSKLVSGFSKPLSSLPKIEKQVAIQLKLIKSGRAEDTGLLVGDEATASQVQVVDAASIQAYQNTIVPSPPPTPPKSFGNDANITSSTLDPNQVASQSFVLPTVNDTPIDAFIQGLLFLGINSPSAGFLGNNITINTPTIDLSPYAGKPDFEFMAVGNLNVNGSVTFTGNSEATPPLPATIALIAGGQLSIASGSTLEADTEVFGLAAGSFNTLENISILNSVGDIDILSLSDLSILDSIINAGGSVDIESQNGTLTFDEGEAGIGNAITAGNSVYLFGEAGVNVNNSSVAANSGDVEVTSYGDLNVLDSEIDAISESGLGSGSVNLFSSGQLTLDESGSESAVRADNSVTLYGANGVSINAASIVANGNAVNVSSDFGSIMVNNNSYISAPNAVNLTSYGDISILGSQISAEIDADTPGYGSVNISSGGTLTLDLDEAQDQDSINADNSVTLSGDSGVNINAASIYAGGSDGGGVDISSGAGNIAISSTPITANDGDVNINSYNGSLLVDETGTDGNDVIRGNNIYLFGTSGIGINNTVLNAFGGVNISDAPGFSSSTPATINLALNDTVVNAQNGDVNISDVSSSGSVFGQVNNLLDINIMGTTINAPNGSVSISSSSGLLSLGDDTSGVGSSVSAGSSVTFFGQTGVNVNDTTVTASAGPVNVTAGSGQISMGGAAIEADGGNSINMNASGPISMVGGSLNAANGAVNMTSGNSVTISSTELTASSVTVNAAGAISASLNSQSQVAYLTLNSGDGILLDGGNPTPSGVASGTGTMNLTAPNTPGSSVTVKNMDLSSFITPSISAHTIILDNIAFGAGSKVDLDCASGLLAANPNTGASVSIGDVNFVQNVTYNGSPAQNFLVSSAGAQGIYIH